MTKVDVVFSFDNTASMSQCIREVRRKVKEIIGNLLVSIPDIRIGLIAHGDYGSPAYVIRSCDLTNDLAKLVDFVTFKAVDAPNYTTDECYELVLRDCQSLSWRPDADIRRLVLIGDCCPHGKDDPENILHISWEEELVKLRSMDISIYAVQCMDWGRRETEFYTRVARDTDGLYLQLKNFNSIPILFQAICHREQGRENLVNFEQSLPARSREVTRIMDVLLEREPQPMDENNLERAPDGKYQMIIVTGTPAIKQFVQDQNLPFKTGSGYYQLQKKETISAKKSILLRHKQLEDIYEGDVARQYAESIVGSDLGKLTKDSLPNYDIFIQSTSVNRKLQDGTMFLYRVERSLL
jgi:hypothetical protein